jgi:hypothetical protein
MSFKIGEPLKKLPPRKFPAKAKVYTDILEAIESKPKGFYPIEVANKKPMTVYVALAKRLGTRKDLKLHIRGKIVYIEKL